MNLLERTQDRVRCALRWQGFWWVTTMAGVLIVGSFLSWLFWGDLRGKDESLSTAIRNVGIVIGGIEAMLLAAWRSTVAGRQAVTAERQAETALRQTETGQRQAETALRQTETAQRQAETAQRQAETAQRQAEIAQQGLLNERYQKGAEMLGSENLAVRLAGIYAFQRLAEEHPEQYHIQIMQLFCAFVRNPTGEAEGPVSGYGEDGEPILSLREDAQAVMYAIGRRSDAGIALERAERNFRLDLRKANLHSARLLNSNLSHAVLDNANLSSAYLNGANLSGAHLSGADLSDASLSDANLSNSTLNGANLSNSTLDDAEFSDASLSGANLSNTFLVGANFFLAYLDSANLSDAHLAGADLSGSHLAGTDLTRASFYEIWLPDEDPSPANGLLQGQLDQARSDPDNPPYLEGVLDDDTGEQLVWRGKPLDDDP